MKKKKIKREFSAGGVVFRREPSASSGQVEILWLVIKPIGSEKWRLPKGWIGKNESSLEAAQREVTKEAGIKAEVLGKVGTEKIDWLFFKEAKERLAFPKEKELLEKANEKVQEGIQPTLV